MAHNMTSSVLAMRTVMCRQLTPPRQHVFFLSFFMNARQHTVMFLLLIAAKTIFGKNGWSEDDLTRLKQ